MITIKYNVINLNRNIKLVNSHCRCISYAVNQNNSHYTFLNRKIRHNQKRTIAAVPEFPSHPFTESYVSNSGIFKTLSESVPVQFLQTSLVDIHSYTGLPWWGTIVCSTILLRSSTTVPLAIYQQYILAKLELLKYEMDDLVKELKKEASIAAKMYYWNEDTTKKIYEASVKSQWNKLIVRENCHPFKTTLLLWVQIPLWVSLSMSLRNLIYMQPSQDLAAQTVFVQLSTEGIGWIQNLTELDGSFLLPVLFGVINLSIIELTAMSKVQVPTRFQMMITNMFRGFSIILIPISAVVPSGLLLYWTSSSIFGLIQNITLMSPRVKRFFRIPPTPSELDEPYKQLAAAIKKRFGGKT